MTATRPASDAAISAGSALYPRVRETYTYGTAGFRTLAEVLDSVLFRMGLLAVLRSKALHGQWVGVMVTASHNEERDNGVKLVEPMGEMLVPAWEVYAAQLANAVTDAALVEAVAAVVAAAGIDLAQPARVVYAADTRPSGPRLIACLEHGLRAMDAATETRGLGVATTPELHYVVCCLNTRDAPRPYGQPDRAGYLSKLATAFGGLVTTPPPSPLHVDCANGVGSLAMTALLETLRAAGTGALLDVRLMNTATATPGALNRDCGADFVKFHQKPPAGLRLQEGDRWCSLDGDADRIVFYYVRDGAFRLLDGDKIAVLAAVYIRDLLAAAQLAPLPATAADAAATPQPLTVGIVQTAYANGSATAYIRDVLKLQTVCTPTGVKHLHHAAQAFDVGVYFEANGHGTVLFSPRAVALFHAAAGATPAQQAAIVALRALTDLINQTVGDAISDLLLVEAALAHARMAFPDWDALYTDLPNRQVKVRVADRHQFVPIKADTELAEPAALQDQIRGLVAQTPQGRCFVRPSGTEDVVRVYAEAQTVADTVRLAQAVCDVIYDHHGGLGDRPRVA
ncbi:hypothetical protein CXG81DRAFT_15406 [Caulochytrium protostelioides]|uniref:Phosphoacetylglucosamine mutase n=1 Tax=Caulochytrium protostelioides TaxID=1555241 RepID=A0A4P9WZ46_9FUNG|nr:hypothetical protein CXG81DRAFT_15406 [Caulochytrium protostelioides]|eukprot:RKO98819.1 hypothetical protein CXG81DRAFT_15406 [Caulochytrium protostelioides]